MLLNTSCLIPQATNDEEFFKIYDNRKFFTKEEEENGNKKSFFFARRDGCE